MKDKDREFYTKLFVRVANICRPTNPDYPNFEYPMRVDDVHQTWKRSDSSSWAHLGRYTPSYIGVEPTEFVKYAVDLDYFNSQSKERVLTITVHEVTHIEEGSHTAGSVHNPTFWESMISNGREVIVKIDLVEPFIGEVNINNFVEEMADDPNRTMIDLRMETVDDRKNKIWNELKEYKDI